MADEAVAILERSVTERLNVHRRELDHLDDQMIALRDDIGKALADIDKRLAAIEKSQAVENTIIESGMQSVAALQRTAYGVGIAIIIAAISVILFGPGAP